MQYTQQLHPLFTKLWTENGQEKSNCRGNTGFGTEYITMGLSSLLRGNGGRETLFILETDENVRNWEHFRARAGNNCVVIGGKLFDEVSDCVSRNSSLSLGGSKPEEQGLFEVEPWWFASLYRLSSMN